MASDVPGARHADHGETFPFVRMLGPVAIIGVNSAVPTPPLVALGRVGAAQIARLATILERLGRAHVFRLMLIHHPPLTGQARRYRDLVDAGALEAVLARHGAELVIHGHNHRNMLAWCRTTAGGKVAVVGAPSAALARPHKREPLARYNLYRIAGPPWTIELIGRGLERPGGPIVELERKLLS
jgi:3',5'-cyclic AMP phosphodiesterase CpdA